METTTAPTTEAAAPEAAPQAPQAAPDATPETAAPSTPDVFATPEAAPEQTNIINSLYTSEGGLAENYTALLDEHGLGNLANTVGKYKSADGLLKGAANLINFAGKKVEGTIVPNEGSTEAEIAEYRQAIGVPESPTAYDIQPENMPEGLEWNDEVGGFWQGKFHELGIPQAQAQEIAQAYSDFTGQQLEQARTVLDAQSTAETQAAQAAVQKEWGADYEKNMQSAVSMAEVKGFDLDNPADIAAMRNPKVLNMFLAEHKSNQEGVMPRGAEQAPSKSYQELAMDLKSKHPNMEMAPPGVYAKYIEFMKLSAKQQQ